MTTNHRFDTEVFQQEMRDTVRSASLPSRGGGNFNSRLRDDKVTALCETVDWLIHQYRNGYDVPTGSTGEVGRHFWRHVEANYDLDWEWTYSEQTTATEGIGSWFNDRRARIDALEPLSTVESPAAFAPVPPTAVGVDVWLIEDRSLWQVTSIGTTHVDLWRRSPHGIDDERTVLLTEVTVANPGDPIERIPGTGDDGYDGTRLIDAGNATYSRPWSMTPRGDRAFYFATPTRENRFSCRTVVRRGPFTPEPTATDGLPPVTGRGLAWNKRTRVIRYLDQIDVAADTCRIYTQNESDSYALDLEGTGTLSEWTPFDVRTAWIEQVDEHMTFSTGVHQGSILRAEPYPSRSEMCVRISRGFHESSPHSDHHVGNYGSLHHFRVRPDLMGIEIEHPLEGRVLPHSGVQAWNIHTGRAVYVSTSPTTGGTVDQMDWDGSDWVVDPVPHTHLRVMQAGDPVVSSNAFVDSSGTTVPLGTRATVTRVGRGDITLRVTPVGGITAVDWPLHRVAYDGPTKADGAAASTDDVLKVVDGVEYLLKSVVDKDMADLAAILHKRADENGLCSVYDRSAREVDQATTYLKMGRRPRTRQVSATIGDMTATFRSTMDTPLAEQAFRREINDVITRFIESRDLPDGWTVTRSPHSVVDTSTLVLETRRV